jgi:hypothetical protein
VANIFSYFVDDSGYPPDQNRLAVIWGDPCGYQRNSPIHRDGGMDAVSQLLNGVIRKRMKIDAPKLAAYSSQHTMKDKMRMTRAATNLQQGILGHGKRGSEDDYGDGELLRYMLDEPIKADDLTHWGN